MHTITIRVQDGFVQAVEGVPPGVTVRVLDFDCDDHLDGMGVPCLRTDYHHKAGQDAAEEGKKAAGVIKAGVGAGGG